jgi:hypothetical protein
VNSALLRIGYNTYPEGSIIEGISGAMAVPTFKIQGLGYTLGFSDSGKAAKPSELAP